MIGNLHDPGTPLTYSRTAARQSGSHLITYEGWGHTAYYPGEQVSLCVNAAVEVYLINLTVPRNLTCPAVSAGRCPRAGQSGRDQRGDLAVCYSDHARLAHAYPDRW